MSSTHHRPDSSTSPTRVPGSTITVPAAPAIPERIGHYHVVRAIASGGMGAVYEAIQEQPRRTVALKLMRQGLRAPAARRRFEYEAQILARLRHPGIAQVYEAGTHRFIGASGAEEELPYFAMEFVPDARTLTDYATAKGLTPGQRLELFAEACDAVHHGHQKGIVHRDLKPGNILVDSSGRPKIIDFGVARAVDADMAGTILQTAAGELIGTLQYMSPEQLGSDSRELDARADVYALGVVLFELLTGRLPYDLTGVSAARAPAIVRDQAPVRPSAIDASLRGDAETIILTALHKDRDRRYASAAALAADVRCLLASRPIAARRDSAVYILRTRARASVMRHPLGASLLAAGIGFLIGLWPAPPVVFRWTHLGAWYERTAMAWLGAPPGEALEGVCVAAITEQTDVESLAAGEGIEGVRDGQAFTWRPLHGRLMERLARGPARPTVMVWDLTFTSPGDDAGFAEGVRSLQRAGVDTVVAAEWALQHDEAIKLRPAFLEAGARWGGFTFMGDGGVPWRLDLVAERGQRGPRSSLALEAWASATHPSSRTEYILHDRAFAVEIRFDAGPGKPAIDPVRKPTTQFGRVREPKEGLRLGDMIGGLLLEPMPDEETLRRATIPYEDLFRLDDSALKARLDRKALIVVNLRAGAHGIDVLPHPDGRRIAVPYAHAIGLDILLRGAAIRMPRPADTLGLTASAACVGVALAWFAGRKRWLLALLLVGALGASVGASLFAVRLGSYLCNPAVPLLSLFVAAMVAVWIVGARRARLAGVGA